MENIATILSIASAALGFLATALTYILKFIKSEKAKKVAEQIISIVNAVTPYVVQAEQFANYSGEEKKNFVMTKANQFAIANGIPFDEELISDKIEELINLSKQVNSREKDAV